MNGILLNIQRTRFFYARKPNEYVVHSTEKMSGYGYIRLKMLQCAKLVAMFRTTGSSQDPVLRTFCRSVAEIPEYYRLLFRGIAEIREIFFDVLLSFDLIKMLF